MIDLTQKKRIAIYKPFGIGDSLFGLVISSLLKDKYPHCHITYIGTIYPKELLITHHSIDDYVVISDEQKITAENLKTLNYDVIVFAKSDREFMKIAKKAKIPIRIGFGDKIYTFLYCNYYSGFFKTKKVRHNSHRLLHDYLLYQCIDPKSKLSPNQIIEKITYHNNIPAPEFNLDKNKFKLIIHPGAQSAQFRNWTPEHYREFIKSLDKDQFQIILTGNANETGLCHIIKKDNSADIIDLSGKLNLTQLKQLINQCDGLIAASTGPLHLSALMGKHTLGIYPSNHKDGVSAWGAVGKNAIAISLDKVCHSPCNKAKSQCACITAIAINDVKNIIIGWADNTPIESPHPNYRLWVSAQDLC
ncbi:glycosyltransferase family 9 protein [Facilibium subflavum]|uniref:glycosyltransferase family 9 protein n=1 Tax=Facilibium subflavum TaxID=2219058 RepID=UPI000E656ED8|nr:glycosyltransferase family 9 protein [Facilibium subflavum]